MDCLIINKNIKNTYTEHKYDYLKLKNIKFGGSLDKKSGAESMDKIKVDYSENLSEPWFTLISLGLKTVEGRKNKGRFKDMKIGDMVEWHNNDFLPRTVMTRITRKVEYSTFKEYLKTEGLNNCLPGMPDIEHGLSVYYKYYTKEDEKKYGVVAIEIEIVH